MIFILLKDREQADAVAAAIQGEGYQVKTWTELNELLVLVNDFSNAYLMIIYLSCWALPPRSLSTHCSCPFSNARVKSAFSPPLA